MRLRLIGQGATAINQALHNPTRSSNSARAIRYVAGTVSVPNTAAAMRTATGVRPSAATARAIAYKNNGSRPLLAWKNRGRSPPMTRSASSALMASS